jgi:hypothetical protein
VEAKHPDLSTQMLRKAPLADDHTSSAHIASAQKPPSRTLRADDAKRSIAEVEHISGNFICPVRDCPRSISVESFSTYDNFRRHVCGSHPASNHAIVLEAVYAGKP